MNLEQNNNHKIVNASDEISLTANARARIIEIKLRPENKNKFLRITVSGGGCSGFQYGLALDDKIADDDYKLKENDEIMLATDAVSLEFLHNCSIDFVQDLGGSQFKVNNPNATASCGCGSSFSV